MASLDWQREFEALPDRDKEQFSRVLSLLFDQTFLLRDVWDAKEERLVGSRDYRFAERVRPLLDAYLGVSGWALQVDTLRGVMALYNRFGRNKQSMDKLTTYILYILRLLYDEKLEEVSGRREIMIWLGELYDKLHSLGLVDKKLPVTRLQTSVMRLRKLSVIDRVDGDGIQPDSRWIVYPTIRMLVSEDRINRMYEMLEQGEFDEDDSEDSAEDLDDGVEDSDGGFEGVDGLETGNVNDSAVDPSGGFEKDDTGDTADPMASQYGAKGTRGGAGR